MTEEAGPSLSFNEVEGLATKAARGAGLGWGHAEDLGRAARWLAARGFDWAGPLLRLLDHDGALPEVTALVRLSDRAGSAGAGDTWSAGHAARALAVPLLAASVYGRAVRLVLRWPDTTLVLAADGAVRFETGEGLLESEGPMTIEALRGEAPGGPPALAMVARPAPLAGPAFRRLSAYADKTAVPSSTTSRLRGAGSGRSDDD